MILNDYHKKLIAKYEFDLALSGYFSWKEMNSKYESSKQFNFQFISRWQVGQVDSTQNIVKLLKLFDCIDKCIWGQTAY